MSHAPLEVLPFVSGVLDGAVDLPPPLPFFLAASSASFFLAASSALYMLSGRLDHRACILSCVYQRLTEEDCNRRFTIAFNGSQYRELHIRELTAQHRQYTA